MKVEDGVEDRLGRSVDHVVGYQKKLVVALNTGQPYVLKAPQFYGFGKSIRKIADEIQGAEVSRQAAGLGVAGSAELSERVTSGEPAEPDCGTDEGVGAERRARA